MTDEALDSAGPLARVKTGRAVTSGIERWDTACFAVPHHSDPDAWLVQFHDDRVFLVLASRCREFAEASDTDALPAFTRAMRSNPDLFRLLEKPKPELETSVLPGLAADLTPRDRQRLRAIVDKHWRFYFADRPTNQQKDQLIDAIGVEAATKVVRKAVDGGRVH